MGVEEDGNWHDMSPDEQEQFIEREAFRITGRLLKKVESASKRSAKKVGAQYHGAAGRISRNVANKLRAML